MRLGWPFEPTLQTPTLSNGQGYRDQRWMLTIEAVDTRDGKIATFSSYLVTREDAEAVLAEARLRTTVTHWRLYNWSKLNGRIGWHIVDGTEGGPWA